MAPSELFFFRISGFDNKWSMHNKSIRLFEFGSLRQTTVVCDFDSWVWITWLRHAVGSTLRRTIALHYGPYIESLFGWGRGFIPLKGVNPRLLLKFPTIILRETREFGELFVPFYDAFGCLTPERPRRVYRKNGSLDFWLRVIATVSR